MDIFKGLQRAYGKYETNNETKKDGKIIGRQTIVRKEVNIKLWEKHLNGEIGIGIIPIRDNATCYFGAIDIDIYDTEETTKVIKDIYDNKYPLLPCRSKSGGLHCYIFISEPVKAKDLRKKLLLFASMLGHGNADIFPRQNEVLAERGDLGSPLNMPYFNYENTQRYGYNSYCKPMSIKNFIQKIKSIIFSLKEFKQYKIDIVEDIENGPPCLQYLLSQGFSLGTRNEGLFNIGIYLKKYKPDWQTQLDSYNLKYMVPPLSTQEVMSIINSLDKKDYHYSCTKPPFNSYCNKIECQNREFGVGNIEGMPLLTSLTKFDTVPPIWFADTDTGQRIELSTEEIQVYRKFQRRCIAVLHTFPQHIKEETWINIMQKLLENLTIIEAPTESSEQGMVLVYLETFCTSRYSARNIDEILMGKPFTNKEEYMHYFRMQDFMLFLFQQNFRAFRVNKISFILRENGASVTQLKLKGKNVRVWKFPVFEEQDEDFKPIEFKDEEYF